MLQIKLIIKTVPWFKKIKWAIEDCKRHMFEIEKYLKFTSHVYVVEDNSSNIC